MKVQDSVNVWTFRLTKARHQNGLYSSLHFCDHLELMKPKRAPKPIRFHKQEKYQ